MYDHVMYIYCIYTSKHCYTSLPLSLSLSLHLSLSLSLFLSVSSRLQTNLPLIGEGNTGIKKCIIKQVSMVQIDPIDKRTHTHVIYA